MMTVSNTCVKGMSVYVLAVSEDVRASCRQGSEDDLGLPDDLMLDESVVVVCDLLLEQALLHQMLQGDVCHRRIVVIAYPYDHRVISIAILIQQSHRQDLLDDFVHRGVGRTTHQDVLRHQLELHLLRHHLLPIRLVCLRIRVEPKVSIQVLNHVVEDVLPPILVIRLQPGTSNAFRSHFFFHLKARCPTLALHRVERLQ